MRSSFAYEPDLEIERTSRITRKKQRIKKKHKAWEASPKMDATLGSQRRTLQDFVTHGVQGISSSIARPTVEVNYFELRPALVSVVLQTQFGGSPMEDPNLHLLIFSEVCYTLKLNGVSIDAICV